MTGVHLLPLTTDGVAHVARAMREADRCEVYATRFDDDPDALAHDLAWMSRIGAVFAAGGRPVAAIGAVECWPGVWSAWMIATDRWPLVARTATRWIRCAMMHGLIAAGAHRCECRSIDGHAVAHRWLRHFGAEAEAVHRDFGRNRETFITFAWRLEHVRQHLLAGQTETATAAAADRR